MPRVEYLTGMQAIVEHDALRAKPGQTPDNTKLTLWEQRVRSMSVEELNSRPRNAIDRKNRIDYMARWGGLPGFERVAEVQTPTRGRTNGRG